MKSKLALLNSTVLTSNGIFKLTDLSLQEARNLVLQKMILILFLKITLIKRFL